MPTIHVSNLADLEAHLHAVRPSHLVSMLADDAFPETPEWIADADHLRLRFHDIAEPLPDHVAPGAHHLHSLIDFARGWPGEAPIVVHCFAGVSRSTAAALTVLALHNPGREAEAAALLRARAPHAYPNRLMIRLVDEILALDGRLVAAVEAMEEADYQTLGTLVELPLRLE
ncbi:MAG: protein tyrosine phosphatase [Alphaproteobacteria bacterium]